MKRAFITIIILILRVSGFCQDWTDEQLDKANTAAAVTVLSEEEKDAIMYINLARMYPKDFAHIELEDVSDLDIVNMTYVNSLIIQLESATAAGPLYFEQSLYDYAKCFAKESGEKGTVGHKRKNCPKNLYAECCSYGVSAGWDIALQWLIDDNVSSLGHRKNCLNKTYNKIGFSIHSHKKYRICAVADFSE